MIVRTEEFDKVVSILDKAILAARDSMHSVLETARRTNTPVIIYRNGRIEHHSPDAFHQQQDGSFAISEVNSPSDAG